MSALLNEIKEGKYKRQNNFYSENMTANYYIANSGTTFQIFDTILGIKVNVNHIKVGWFYKYRILRAMRKGVENL